VTRNTPYGVESPNARSKPPRRSAEQRRAPAARMRLHRKRKRRGLRCITVELRNSEVLALITKGFLQRGRHDDRRALVDAVHTFLDQTLVV
jgi:hypothetical protein